MSTKRFCDACANELNQFNDAMANPIVNIYGGVVFKIEGVGFNDPGKGDVCRVCVLDAVASCDTRGRPEAGRK